MVINRFQQWLAASLVVSAVSIFTLAPASAERLRGTVSIDGSSTVFPISEAVAEEFLAVQPRVRVTVGVSGTGGGFKKFLAGEIDINDASRPIKMKEVKQASASGIGFIELPIAYDGLSVVVNTKNDWVDHLTITELNKIWQPGSSVTRWSDVRDGWPETEIQLYGPGTDSGTFDYFTETINGKSGASRPDYTANEDDNALVRGISGDEGSLGYFGYAYYAANKDKLRVVAIDGGKGPVAPTEITINNGTYAPLSRPVFIYVRPDALDRKEVRAFVDFYIESAPMLATEVGYIPLPDSVYAGAKQRVESREIGTAYHSEALSQSANLLTDN
ncbi:MAG: PstS family phosphate ABC transporter substrate-binding protein [Pseudomonadales bacterium]|jgi:phosphate transport system substrate-binding protein|nr:PstS family phosphate ABC transporter substrate-binding protein [Pseudomonadales bacterium]MDC0892802.1 PstS family phosphate ABC transporter substrate-binding protein [Pseudomonadales bacterium]MDG0999692.1 PstS family phosphate ABC transporter substrate-binding protein [Pseudomonadales bacterium]MDG1302968.1 PstS family phosphate ABC transporter substrate-binding protein [Pseudomonadales bacterium]MDG1833943.1 PstS family phosphate ABC transporter substrate-binding protein [Pseudomonadales